MSETITTTNNRLSLAIEAIVLTLMAVGTVFVFSAGANVRTDYSLREFYNFTTLKQLVFFPLAVLVIPGALLPLVSELRVGFGRSPLRTGIRPGHWLWIVPAVLLVFMVLRNIF